MRSTTSGHTAQRLTSGGWVLSWLPGRMLTRNQAVSGLLLADTAGDGLEPGDSRWPALDAWARELDLSGPEAVVRVSTSDEVRQRIAHSEVQECAERLYRRHERYANDVRDAIRSGDQQAVQDAQAELRRSQNELSTHLTAHRYEVSLVELPWLRYWQNPTYRQQRTELAGWHQIHDQAEARAAGQPDSDRGTEDREFWSVDPDGTAFFDHEAVQYWAGAQPGWPGTELSSQVWSALPVDEDVFQAAVESAGEAGAFRGDEASPQWRERVEQAAAAMGDRDPAVMQAWRQVCADETFTDARDLYEARLVAAHESTPPDPRTGTGTGSGGVPIASIARDTATDRRDEHGAEDVVIVCGDCELDFDDQHDRGEAVYLAGVHNELHHAGRPAAVVVPVDVPVDDEATAQASTPETTDNDAAQRARLAELTARAEAARADAVAMTGPVETSDAGRAWSERVDAAVFGLDAADPAELDRWMQRHGESSQPHVKEAELVAAWETHRATTTGSESAEDATGHGSEDNPEFQAQRESHAERERRLDWYRQLQWQEQLERDRQADRSSGQAWDRQLSQHELTALAIDEADHAADHPAELGADVGAD